MSKYHLAFTKMLLCMGSDPIMIYFSWKIISLSLDFDYFKINIYRFTVAKFGIDYNCTKLHWFEYSANNSNCAILNKPKRFSYLVLLNWFLEDQNKYIPIALSYSDYKTQKRHGSSINICFGEVA